MKFQALANGPLLWRTHNSEVMGLYRRLLYFRCPVRRILTFPPKATSKQNNWCFYTEPKIFRIPPSGPHRLSNGYTPRCCSMREGLDRVHIHMLTTFTFWTEDNSHSRDNRRPSSHRKPPIDRAFFFASLFRMISRRNSEKR